MCGEETAMLNSIEHQRPVARTRPPYVSERRLDGEPTVVNNVETLASVPWIIRNGADQYATMGFASSRGTKAVSLNSLFCRPGLYEIEFGMPLRRIVEDCGGGLRVGQIAGPIVGGPLAGVIPPSLFDTRFGFEELHAIGASVGHGGIVAFDARTSIAELMHHVFSFGAYESCGKCLPCRLGCPTIEHMPAYVREWDEFRNFICEFTPERVSDICGVDPQAIRRAAREYAIDKPAMSIHVLGVTEHVQGTEGVMCLVNLALLTGNLGIPGAGVNPLRGQNNVQGAAHMGCDPGILTGSVAIADAVARFESVWHAAIPTRPGLNLMKMIDASADGRFRALWAMGYDVALTNPIAEATVQTLQSLDLVIVQDMFLTETAKLAGTVFLPVASSFEKDGTFMNSERRVQRVRKVIDPPGECRTDWQIICDVAAALGHSEGFAFHSAEEIWEEVRAVWPAGSGITYERLDEGGLQWPCPTTDHPGTGILHTDIFSSDRSPTLRRITPIPTTETVSTEYPLLLTTGRALYQFNAGTMTSRSQTHELRPIDLLLVSPDDAHMLGIENGQVVRITSRYGQVTICASISTRVRPGEIFATFHSPETYLNRVISDRRDRFVQTPEYKVTAVRVERV